MYRQFWQLIGPIFPFDQWAISISEEIEKMENKELNTNQAKWQGSPSSCLFPRTSKLQSFWKSEDPDFISFISWSHSSFSLRFFCSLPSPRRLPMPHLHLSCRQHASKSWPWQPVPVSCHLSARTTLFSELSRQVPLISNQFCHYCKAFTSWYGYCILNFAYSAIVETIYYTSSPWRYA